jgi:hypothetical protein
MLSCSVNRAFTSFDPSLRPQSPKNANKNQNKPARNSRLSAPLHTLSQFPKRESPISIIPIHFRTLTKTPGGYTPPITPQIRSVSESFKTFPIHTAILALQASTPEESR